MYAAVLPITTKMEGYPPAGVEPARELPTITFTKQSAGATGIAASLPKLLNLVRAKQLFRHGGFLLQIHVLIDSFEGQLLFRWVFYYGTSTIFDVAAYAFFTVSTIERAKGSHNYSFTLLDILKDYILKTFNCFFADSLREHGFSCYLFDHIGKVYVIWIRHC